MKSWQKIVLLGLSISLGLAVVVRIIPWSSVNWGKIETLPGSTVTVTGEAKSDQLPQVARFTATVSVFNPDKQTAVDKVNSDMDELIGMVKNFGIEAKDIKTQQVSVYETKEGTELMIYPPRPGSGQAGWQATNTITITLRNIDQASALADLLQKSKATSVSGPSLTIDDTADFEAALLKEAIDDARQKATVIAQASGRKLGKVITVSESGSSLPLYRGVGAAVVEDAAPTPIEPGTQTVTKTVTVLFELK